MHRFHRSYASDNVILPSWGAIIPVIAFLSGCVRLPSLLSIIPAFSDMSCLHQSSSRWNFRWSKCAKKDYAILDRVIFFALYNSDILVHGPKRLLGFFSFLKISNFNLSVFPLDCFRAAWHSTGVSTSIDNKKTIYEAAAD